MSPLRTCAFAVLVAGVLTSRTAAHESRPAYLEMRETGPGTYEVLFKVPRRGDLVLSLRPVLPPAFREVSPPTVEVTPGAQVTRWSVEAEPAEVAGRPLSIGGLGGTFTDTFVRIQFADGRVLTRVLTPESPSWAMPDATSTATEPAERSPGGDLRDGVLAGGRHLGISHVVFLLGVVLAGRGRGALLALLAFAAGHLAGILGGPAIGASIPAPPSEALLGVAGALAAVLALRASRRDRSLITMAGITGIVHGVVLASELPGPALRLVAATIGVDAAQVLLALAAVGMLRIAARIPARPVVTYAVGAGGILLALVTVTRVPEVEAGSEVRPPLMALATPGSEPGAPIASTPVLSATEGPLQVFVHVDPFEVRLEAVGRVRDLAPLVGIEISGETIEVAAQPAVKDSLEDLFANAVAVRVDGRAVPSANRRLEFVHRTETGTFEREEPVDESWEDALVGLRLSCSTGPAPDEIRIAWGVHPGGDPVPATVVDPEETRSVTVSPGLPEILWRNELRLPLVPTLAAVKRRTGTVGLPTVALALIALAGVAVLVGLRRKETVVGSTIARGLLAAACLAGPLLELEVARPAPEVPEPEVAGAVVEALLGNVYRAIEDPVESSAYDRLAVGLTGENLQRVYLEQRRAQESAGRGGPRARVASVEVLETGDPAPVDGGGFRVDAGWRTGGFVVHYGHRHYRENVYRARITVVPSGDAWKIRDLEASEATRER